MEKFKKTPDGGYIADDDEKVELTHEEIMPIVYAGMVMGALIAAALIVVSLL